MLRGLLWRKAIVCSAIASLTSVGMAEDVTDAKRIAKAKDAVAYQLFDPDSATFRNVHARSTDVCGEVNAKNRYGGYVGYRTFWVLLPPVFADEDRKLLVEIDGPDSRTASRMCALADSE